jgi:hypothetical protein
MKTAFIDCAVANFLFIELLPPQLNAMEIRLDGVFTRDSNKIHSFSGIGLSVAPEKN